MVLGMAQRRLPPVSRGGLRALGGGIHLLKLDRSLLRERAVGIGVDHCVKLFSGARNILQILAADFRFE
jgi:hypothetical protein